MEKKTFNLLTLVIVLAISMVIGWAVPAREPGLIVAVFFVGMSAIYLLKKKVNGVIADEMSYRIVERTARITYAVFASLATLSAGVLIALRDANPNYGIAGYTLAYSVCILLLIFWAFYVYYSSRGIE